MTTSNKKRTRRWRMDSVDKKILSILYRDGRTSLSSIGEKLGMSHVAVGKRLDRLTKSQPGQKKENMDCPSARITAAVNVEKVDAKIIFIGLETETMEVAERLVEKYKQCPRLLMLAPVTGRYNLFAVMIVDDMISLESILGTCSIRVEEGVRRSESWFGNAPAVPQFFPIDLSPEKLEGEEDCECDCEECKRYKMNKCVGCPLSKVYSGTLWRR